MDDTFYPPNFYKNTPPGIDPTVRTAVTAAGSRSVYGPGQNAGETATWREVIASFTNNRDSNTVNTCIFRGFNYGAGAAQIDGSKGSVGSGEENSYQPLSPAETWCEWHNRGTAPGGVERRFFSGYVSWETGRTGLTITVTNFGLEYQPLVGSPTQMLSFVNGGSINLNVPFIYATTSSPVIYQLENGSGYYIYLPYVATNNEIIRGWNPNQSRIPIGRERGIHFDPTAPADIPTPATGATLFFSSATSAWASKDSSGTVTAV